MSNLAVEDDDCEWLAESAHYMQRKHREEKGTAMIIKTIIEPDFLQKSTFNRDTRMSADEKSDRLWTMMSTHPCSSMIMKPNKYDRVTRREHTRLNFTPIENTLFDGCHRLRVVQEFMEGKCYVKIHDAENRTNFRYCWASQAILDALAPSLIKSRSKVLPKAWMTRLMTCPIYMIELDENISDAEAYFRAQQANKCKPMTTAAILKNLCCVQTALGKLLQTMADPSIVSPLYDFMDDETYRVNASIIRVFAECGFSANYGYRAKMLKGKDGVRIAESIVNSPDRNSDIYLPTNALGAVAFSRNAMDKVITAHAQRGRPLRKTCTSTVANVGSVYFSLTLAVANAQFGACPFDFISDSKVLEMFDKYSSLPAVEKVGESHKRLYTYFTTGVFPARPERSVKRTAGQAGLSSGGGGSRGGAASSSVEEM